MTWAQPVPHRVLGDGEDDGGAVVLEWFVPGVGDGLEDGHGGGGCCGVLDGSEGLADAVGAEGAGVGAALGDAVGDEDEAVAGRKLAVGGGEGAFWVGGAEWVVVGGFEFFDVSVGVCEVGVGVAAVDPGEGVGGGVPAGD